MPQMGTVAAADQYEGTIRAHAKAAAPRRGAAPPRPPR